MSKWKPLTGKFTRSASPATLAHGSQTYPPLLIVDDEPEIDQTLKELFEESGYPILSASNGEDALRILRERPERLIILLDSYYARTGR